MAKKKFKDQKKVVRKGPGPITSDPLGVVLGEAGENGDNKEEPKETPPEVKPEDSESPTPQSNTPPEPEPEKPKPQRKPKINENSLVRHSFQLYGTKLDKLKDFVYTKKVSGDFRYSQFAAIDEALDLLFATENKIMPRSDEERQREEEHSRRIKDGRKD